MNKHCIVFYTPKKKRRAFNYSPTLAFEGEGSPSSAPARSQRHWSAGHSARSLPRSHLNLGVLLRSSTHSASPWGTLSIPGREGGWCRQGFICTEQGPFLPTSTKGVWTTVQQLQNLAGSGQGGPSLEPEPPGAPSLRAPGSGSSSISAKPGCSRAGKRRPSPGTLSGTGCALGVTSRP